MTSIVIPAHNEEQVIGRCLSTLLAGAEPDEFDVVVATNGCSDRTAEVAGSFPGVRVVDSPVASKPAALTLGDEQARGFPRIYLDADIEVDAPAVRAVAAALSSGDFDLAAPRLELRLEGRPWGVRAYYDVWTRLPYVRDDLVGVGFYALSEAARSRFGDFPDTMAEDFFIHSLVPAARRTAVVGHTFVMHPPLTLRSLAKIQTRIQAANLRNRDLFADAAAEVHSSHVHELMGLARNPRLWPQLAVYGGVMVWSKARARAKNRSKTVGVWDRDTTARAQAAS